MGRKISLIFIWCLLSGLCQPLLAINPDTLISQRIERAMSQDDPNVALQLLLKIQKLPQLRNVSCATKALLLHKIGVCHYSLKKYRSALSYYDSALVLRQQCLGRLDKETANSYYAVAMAYEDLGDREQAVDNIKQSLDILEMLPKRLTHVLAYRYLRVGSLFHELGDLWQAATFLEQAERYYSRLANPDTTEVAEVYKIQGLVSEEKEQYQESVRRSFLAFGLFKKYNPLDDENFANCHQNLSLAYIGLVKLDSAELHTRLALRLNKRLKNLEEQSKNIESLGRIRKRQGQLRQALAFFEQSLALRKKHGSNPKLLSDAHENIADIHLLLGNEERAIEGYQAAIRLLCPAEKASKKVVPPPIGKPIYDRQALLRVLSLQADALHQTAEKNGDKHLFALAYQFYRCYDSLHVQVRQRYGDIGSKYWLMQEAKPVYEAAICTAMRLHELSGETRYLEEAYRFSAKNKAAVLREGLQELNAKLSELPLNLQKQEKELRRIYVQAEKKFFESKKDSERDSLSDGMFEARWDYDKLIARLEREFPEYHRHKYKNPNLLSVSELQEKLPVDAAVLEYFVGQKDIHVFLVDKRGLRHFSTPKPAGFVENCRALRQLSDGTKAFFADTFRSPANALFHSLLEAPLRALSSETTRLIFIPDEQLLQLSFDILPYREIEPGEEKLPYLVLEISTSIAYSNSLIFKEEGTDSPSEKAEIFGGFGLEYDDLTLRSLRKFAETDSLLKNRSGGRLHNSDDEVKHIARLFRGDAWLNQSATKTSFLENAHRYRILHLAMHAFVDEEQPLNSAMIFAQQNETDDFILRASEIYNLKIWADLVVLSACNTAHGPSTPEGLRSISRAFVHAGCPSLVASLWFANDASSRELLEAFYRHLQTGKPKDVALRDAKLEYLKQASPTDAFPEYWSNMVLIGELRTIEVKNTLPWIWVAAGLAAFLLAALGFCTSLRR